PENTGPDALPAVQESQPLQVGTLHQRDRVERVARTLLGHPQLTGHLLEDMPGAGPSPVQREHRHDEEHGEGYTRHRDGEASLLREPVAARYRHHRLTNTPWVG